VVGGLFALEKYVSGFGSDPIGKLAKAIAAAEGFGPAENVPTRANNPGDLELGDLGNGAVGGKTVFPTLAAGIAALRKQLAIIQNGESANYSLDMSISDMAQKWTGGDNPDGWANEVAQQLGVTPDTKLSEVIG
jgi:hypothetical protein